MSTYNPAAAAAGVAGSKLSAAEIAELYGIPFWSCGYFKAGPEGHLRVSPYGEESSELSVSLRSCLDELVRQGESLPVILRFPQVLEHRLRSLNAAFSEAIRKFGYESHYQGVYPIKVNQRRVVLESLAVAGEPYRTGLEAGSKAELALCLAQELGPEALLCCNGFKDDDFIGLALWGRKLGKNVVLTLEKFGELHRVLQIAREVGVEPALGIRFKLHARGSGKWEDSGGDAAKFGLDAAQILSAVEHLREVGKLDALQMIHCHVGSQITNIRKIKTAVREISRVYTDLVRMGAPLRYLNVGGGLAVDYDGSRTTFYASANYGLQEYADDVVYTAMEVCKEAGVAHPVLVTESGRALTAHHAVIVLSVVDSMGPTKRAPELHASRGKPHALITELEDLLKGVTVKNYAEVFHDSVSHKETMHNLFDLGYLSLAERARVENLFNRITERVARVIRGLEYVPEEFEVLPRLLADKYVCNFSLFQSLPDHWAIQALFPVAPLSRLNQTPSRQATLVDISCDSDGKITKFTDLRDVRATLPLHELRDEDPYYLGVFLTGAYQDVLANSHNLFGRVNEAHIRVTGTDKFCIEHFEKGQQARELLHNMGYEVRQLQRSIRRQTRRALSRRAVSDEQARTFQKRYDNELLGYTYLED